MPRARFGARIVLGLLVAVGGGLSLAGCRPSHGEAAVIDLVARAPEKGNWSPRTIRVERGKEVTLRIRNADVVTHGFYLPALGLTVSAIRAGEVRELTFTPEFEGEAPFYCTVWCSDHHMEMRGTLIAE